MTPANQLNTFIEKLAKWLKTNEPSFVDRYTVHVTNIPGELGKDKSRIRFTINFEVSNAEIRRLEMAGALEEIES